EGVGGEWGGGAVRADGGRVGPAEDAVGPAEDQLTDPGDQVADADEAAGADEVTDVDEVVAADAVTADAGKVSMPRRVARRAGRIPAAWRITIVVVLTLLVAGSGVAAGILDTQTSNDATTQQERDAAATAAKTEVPQILSYNSKTLSADLARANADTTGQFSGQFSVLASQLIGPNAAKQQTVTKATVPVAAAVDSSGNEVTVLVFVDQSTT